MTHLPPVPGWLRFALLLVLMALVGFARAATGPELRVKVLGKQPALVGQQVSIEVTVVAPNFFLSAPPFPQLDVQGAVITMPDERGIHDVQQQGAQTLASIQKTYVFTAQQAGDFELPAVKMAFSYQGDDGKPHDASLSLPSTRIAVQLPAGASAAAAAGTAMPATRLAIRQTLDRDAKHLAAGDALVRTIEIQAANAPAMLIPPPRFEAPSGVRMYAADPVLRDASGQGGGFAGGQRIERVTYVFERAGHYTLPAVTLKWLDPQTQTPANALAPAVEVQVGGGAAAGERIAPELPVGAAVAPARTPIRWGLIVLVVAVLGLLMLLALFIHRRLPAWRTRRAQHQAAHSRSDAVMFEAALAACQAGDARAFHRALLEWSQAHAKGTPQAWANALGDAPLAAQLERLGRHLYRAGGSDEPAWSGSECADALRAAHSRWRHGQEGLAPQRIRGRPLGPLNPFQGGA